MNYERFVDTGKNLFFGASHTRSETRFFSRVGYDANTYEVLYLKRNAIVVIILLIVLVTTVACNRDDAEPTPIEKLTGMWEVVSAEATEQGFEINLDSSSITGKYVLKPNGKGWSTHVVITWFGISSNMEGDSWTADEISITLHPHPPMEYTLEGDLLTISSIDESGIGKIRLKKINN